MTDDELVDAFLTASRALVGVAVRSVQAAPVPVTVAQYRALVLIASGRAGDVSTLQEQLGINQSNVSRLVERLHRLGLVDRARSETDARRFLITLTPLGRDVLDAVTSRRREDISAVLDTMGRRERAEAVRAMRAFAAAAREAADHAWPDDA